MVRCAGIGDVIDGVSVLEVCGRYVATMRYVGEQKLCEIEVLLTVFLGIQVFWDWSD